MAAAKKAAAKGPSRSAFFKVEGEKVATTKKYCPRVAPVS